MTEPRPYFERILLGPRIEFHYFWKFALWPGNPINLFRFRSTIHLGLVVSISAEGKRMLQAVQILVGDAASAWHSKLR
jgi:hypothetical protein